MNNLYFDIYTDILYFYLILNKNYILGALWAFETFDPKEGSFNCSHCLDRIVFVRY